MPAIRVKELTKTYGEVIAVDGIDFEIENGEVVAILGPNGAGKTTTVEMLEGFRKPDSGQIEVLGRDPGDRDRQWLDRIGIVLQHSGIEDELTVVEAITAQARPYSSPGDVDEVIEMVDLISKKDQKIRTLSGGQRRRLDLALGVIGNPELLFLDEPTTGFDPEARRRSWQAIGALAGGGTTVVLTTHYLEEAQELADRVIVIARGQIVATGTPDDLGDRRAGSTIVRFRVQSFEDAARLGVEADATGHVAIETSDAIPLINRITGAALADGIPLEMFEVSRLTLEEAYLRLVAGDE
jgi:ABC-2 type transport system ATP-binding protein